MLSDQKKNSNASVAQYKVSLVSVPLLLHMILSFYSLTYVWLCSLFCRLWT